MGLGGMKLVDGLMTEPMDIEQGGDGEGMCVLESELFFHCDHVRTVVVYSGWYAMNNNCVAIGARSMGVYKVWQALRQP